MMWLILALTGFCCLTYSNCNFQHEIGICRKEQPFEIRPIRVDSSMDFQPDSPPLFAMETEPPSTSQESTSEDAGKDDVFQEPGSQEVGEGNKEEPQPSTSSQPSPKPLPDYSAAKTGTGMM